MPLQIQPATKPGRRRTWALLAVLLALLAGLAGYETVTSFAPEHQVVVAARDIPAWHVLTSDDLQTATVPAASLPVGVVTRMEAAVGRVASHGLLAGDMLRAGHLVDTPGGPLALALREQRGTVGVSVPGDVVGPLLAYLRPGDRVKITTVLPIQNAKLNTSWRGVVAPAATVLYVIPAGQEGITGGNKGALVVAVSADAQRLLDLATVGGKVLVSALPSGAPDPVQEPPLTADALIGVK